jgi:hypothetical protein
MEFGELVDDFLNKQNIQKELKSSLRLVGIEHPLLDEEIGFLEWETLLVELYNTFAKIEFELSDEYILASQMRGHKIQNQHNYSKDIYSQSKQMVASIYNAIYNKEIELNKSIKKEYIEATKTIENYLSYYQNMLNRDYHKSQEEAI